MLCGSDGTCRGGGWRARSFKSFNETLLPSSSHVDLDWCTSRRVSSAAFFVSYMIVGETDRPIPRRSKHGTSRSRGAARPARPRTRRSNPRGAKILAVRGSLLLPWQLHPGRLLPLFRPGKPRLRAPLDDQGAPLVSAQMAERTSSRGWVPGFCPPARHHTARPPLTDPLHTLHPVLLFGKSLVVLFYFLANGGDHVTRKQFKAVMESLERMKYVSHLKGEKLYNYLDSDNDGAISPSEFLLLPEIV